MINRSNYDIKSEEEKINVKTYSDKLLLMRKYKGSKKKNEKIRMRKTGVTARRKQPQSHK